MAQKIEKVFVTEKWTQLEDLSKILGVVPKEKWTPAFSPDGKIAIVPLKGHLYELLPYPSDYDPSYREWSESTVYCFPEEMKKQPKKGAQRQLNLALEVLKRAESIIIASDFDMEGANLAMEVIKAAGVESRVERMLEMGSTTEEALRRTLENPIDIPYENMANAGEARAIVDWVEGMSYSRALTVYLAKKKATLVFGGVKTIVMGMVVERDLQFESHKEIFFYTVRAILEFNGRQFEAVLKKKGEKGDAYRFDKKDQAERFAKRILEEGELRVSSFFKKRKKESPPKLYVLTEISGELSRVMGVDSKAAQEIAQKLYDEYKIQSYPRTAIHELKEADYLMAPKWLENIGKVMCGDIIGELLKKPLIKRSRTFNDKKVTSHGGLVPTEEPKLPEIYPKLTPAEKEMFDRVSKRFIQQFMPDAEYNEYELTIDVGDDFFLYGKESKPVEAGWRLLEKEGVQDEIENYQRKIPDLKSGDTLKIVKTDVKEGKTKPKPRFTEETLVKAMGNIANLYPDDPIIKEELGENGIGTPSSIPGIMDDLFSDVDKSGKKKEPWLMKKGKSIVSSEKTRKLISVMPKEIVSPLKRARMFKDIRRIERGEITLDEFVESYRGLVKENIELIKEVGEKNPISFMRKGDVSLGKCPLCGGEVVERKKAFICSEAKWKKGEDGRLKNEGCRFAIWKNSLEKLGKKSLSATEVRRLLKNGKLKVKLKARNTGETYEKLIEYDEKRNGLSFVKEGTGEVLGVCPFCKGGSVIEKDRSYVCTNARWRREGGEFVNDGCSFQIGKAKYAKMGKKLISAEEIRKLLKNGRLEVRLVSKAGNSYTKWAIPDEKWGLRWE